MIYAKLLNVFLQVDESRAENGKLVASSQLLDASVHHKKGGNLNKKMIYYKRSPTYCDPIADINIPGTSGRVCNSTTAERDSCAALCCGRGYFTKKIRKVEKCNCKFHWCCYVVCEKCEFDEWVTVCKWFWKGHIYFYKPVKNYICFIYFCFL